MVRLSLLSWLTLVLSPAVLLAEKPTIRITSPAEGAIFHPGDTVPVSVSTSGAKFIMMSIEVGTPIDNSQVLTAPPYKFSLHIPRDITPGLYVMTASGVIAPGQGAESKGVSIDVERPDYPMTLNVEPITTIELKVGEEDVLSVVGKYKDGRTATLNGSTQIRFVSLTPKIVTVDKWGNVTAVGVGSTEIVVRVGDKTLRVKVQVEKRHR